MRRTDKPPTDALSEVFGGNTVGLYSQAQQECLGRRRAGAEVPESSWQDRGPPFDVAFNVLATEAIEIVKGVRT